MIDLQTYEPLGDKKNSVFFEEYLPRIYERRQSSGVSDNVGGMELVLIQVDAGHAVAYMAELALMGPYRHMTAYLSSTHRLHVLESQPGYPRVVVLEPLDPRYEDEGTRLNLLYPNAAPTPNARYIGEVYAASDLGTLRDTLESQDARFVYPGESENPLFTADRFLFTYLSDYTENRVGYTDGDLTDIDSLDLGARVDLSVDEQVTLDAAAARHEELDLESRVVGIDHLATRILSGEREDAILEFLSLVPYYFWGAYDIHEMNSSTNVTRNPHIDDDKESPAKVFTANNVPSFVNSFEGRPMPTEEFVRNFGRRMHHMAYAVTDGEIAGEKNVDYVVGRLADAGIGFLAHVVGECKDTPNLKQIFSKKSDYSLLITEYVERCHDFKGFFTRDNVAALTEAAGEDERFAHGQVFD